MKHEWLRVGFFCLLATVAVAGCTSGGTETPPQEPSVPPEEPKETPEPPKPPPEPEVSDFGPDGMPYQPGTTRLLGRTIYFDYDQSVIKPSDLAVLEMHAQVLRKHRDRSVTVEGHCDERGTREYNLALGERRAAAVRTFLTSAGVNRSQIDIVSFGEERPADPGHSERAWSQNRRAIVRYR